MSQIKKLINQKFLEGIDSTKFHVAQDGAIMAKDSSGSMIEFLKVNSDNKGVVLGKVISTKDEIDQIIDDLAAEVAARQTGDISAIASSNSYTDQKIAELVNGAPELLDTLKELADAIGQGGDAGAELAALVGQLRTDLDTEIARAQAAESALGSRIDGVESDVGALEGRMDIAEADIIGVETRMQSAEGRLSLLEPKVDTLESGLAQEILDRQAGDVQALADAKAYTDAEVLEEKGLREAADAQGLVDAKAYTDAEVLEEKNRAEGVEGQLQSAIDAEEAARIAADELKVNKSGDTMSGLLSVQKYDPNLPTLISVSGKSNPFTSVSNGYEANIGPGYIELLQSGMTAMPDSDSHATTKKYVDQQDAAKLVEAKAYTDSEMSEESEARVQGDANTLSSANSYTDAEVLEEKQAREAADDLKVNKSGDTMSGLLTVSKFNSYDLTPLISVYTKSSPFTNISNGLETNIGNGYIELTSIYANGYIPNADNHVTTKKYVDVQDAAKLAEAKSYADGKMDEEKARAEAAEAGLQADIDVEKGRVDAILLASNADKDSFAEVVHFINSVDLENDNALASVVLDLQNADAELDGRLDSVEGRATSLEGRMTTAEGDIDSLESVKADKSYVDAQDDAEESARIAADNALGVRIDTVEGRATSLEGRMTTAESDINNLESVKADITYVDAQIASAQSNLDDVEGYAQDIRDDLDAEIARAEGAEGALDGRLDVLEAMAFYKESKVIGSADLSYVEMAREAKPNSISVFVGRLALHEDQDFSVSVVGGKSRITWMGDFMVGGSEEVEEGMKLFFHYYC